jgi:hypothetical protein
LSEAVHRQELIAINYNSSLALVRQANAAKALPYAQRAGAILSSLSSPMLEQARALLRECWGASAVAIISDWFV